MAFPVAVTRTTTGITAAGSSHVVNLPASLVAGDLVLCMCRLAGNPTGRAFPTGWTKIKDVTQAGTTADWQILAYKILAGGDAEIGAATMTVTLTGGSAKAAYRVYRITGAHASAAPEASADATGNSTTPDPASLSPSWGAADTLWIWAGGWEGEQTTPPAAGPTNYTTGFGGVGSGTGGVPDTNVRVATGDRDLNAASENPGSLTISAADDWMAWTVAVQPAAAFTTNEETGATTSAAVAAGADVHEAVEAGAPTADTLLAGADVHEAARLGASATAAVLAGADVHEAIEAGATTSAAVLAGVAEVAAGGVTYEKTGAAVTATVAAGADVFEAVEAGSGLVTALMAGVSQYVPPGPVTYEKAGSAVASSRAAAADAYEAVESGATVAGTLYVGSDVYEAVETGATVAITLLAGFSEGAAIIVTYRFDDPSPEGGAPPGSPAGTHFDPPTPLRVLA